jgi:hypothetical protein
MELGFTNVNWLAVIAGTIVAYGLGMLWFSPKMFGTGWAAGNRDLQAPDSPPLAARIVQLAGVFLLALVVGVTATTNALITAILAILATAVLIAGSGLFAQKNCYAVRVEAGYVIVTGVILIAAQGLL